MTVGHHTKYWRKSLRVSTNGAKTFCFYCVRNSMQPFGHLSYTDIDHFLQQQTCKLVGYVGVYSHENFLNLCAKDFEAPES